MRTICIYYNRDLDGWMSAAIVKKWFKDTNVYFKSMTSSKITTETGNTIEFIGWDYGDAIPDLSEYDKVIMCDISFSKEVMYKLWHNLDIEIIWIDHHKSAIEENNDLVWKGLQDTKFAACELTWKYFFLNKTMPEIVRLLGRYDCFGHKGTDEEEKVMKFQYGARQEITNYKEAYKAFEIYIGESNIKVVDVALLSNLEKETLMNAKGRYLPYKFLCVNQERFNPINFGIAYHKEEYNGFACFWYKDDKWMFSLYDDNGEIDCSIIAKRYGGGGHKGASGFVCDNETMLNIITSGK